MDIILKSGKSKRRMGLKRHHDGFKLHVVVIPCNFLKVLKIYETATIVTYQVIFIQISITCDNISSRGADKRR